MCVSICTSLYMYKPYIFICVLYNPLGNTNKDSLLQLYIDYSTFVHCLVANVGYCVPRISSSWLAIYAV